MNTAQLGESRSIRADSTSSLAMRAFLPGLLISAAAVSWCRSATGPTLGLFLGGLLLATLIAPPLTAGEKPATAWLASAGILLGVAIVWATALRSADVTTWEWLQCCGVIGAYLLALAGIATIATSAGIPPAPAAGLTLLLGLLWLTWPVWLSPWLTQPMADWLIPANPVFAVNATVRHLGTWDRAPLAYRALSSLNQDVPYQLPDSIVPACMLHAMFGLPSLIQATRALHGRFKPSPPAI